jgi:hypothetical protein
MPVSDLKIEAAAQRKLRPGWVSAHVPIFDAEKLGFIVVAIAVEDGFPYITDGQHRVALLRRVGWGDQLVQCEVYEGLDQSERAALFLARNDVIPVRAFDKFATRITAGDEVAVAVDRIVRAHGLLISENHPTNGAIRSPVACEYIYRGGSTNGNRAEPAALDRTLGILLDAWGADSSVLASPVIKGIGLVCLRYDGNVTDEDMAKRLARVAGGPGGLLARAGLYRDTKGRPVAECVAAAIVDLYNKGRRGSAKLREWWT